jgi:hypothetical protein
MIFLGGTRSERLLSLEWAFSGTRLLCKEIMPAKGISFAL